MLNLNKLYPSSIIYEFEIISSTLPIKMTFALSQDFTRNQFVCVRAYVCISYIRYLEADEIISWFACTYYKKWACVCVCERERPERGSKQDAKTSFRYCTRTGTVGKLPQLEFASARDALLWIIRSALARVREREREIDRQDMWKLRLRVQRMRKIRMLIN